MMSAMVGCGANNASQAAPEATDGAAAETATATEAAASGETTDVALKVWVPNNQIDTGILDEQEAAFEKLHPEWNITWTNEIVGDDVCKDELLKDVDAAGDVYNFYFESSGGWKLGAYYYGAGLTVFTVLRFASQKECICVLISIPIAILFLLTQRCYVEGVSGSVKG